MVTVLELTVLITESVKEKLKYMYIVTILRQLAILSRSLRMLLLELNICAHNMYMYIENTKLNYSTAQNSILIIYMYTKCLIS